MSLEEHKESSIRKDYIGVLELADGTPVRLPMIVADGKEKGPLLVMLAAMHGWEIVGTEVIRQVLFEKLDLNKLRGRIVAIPVANPLAYRAPAYITPQDATDLEGCVPGDPNGSQSQRVGNKLWEIIKGADCYLDLHCIEGPSVPYTILRGAEENPETTEKAMEIAKAYGVQITISSPETLKKRPKSSAQSAVREGIPAVIPELPFPGIIMDPYAIEVGTRGVLNVMKHLKMIDGTIETQKTDLRLDKPLHGMGVQANHGGIAYPLVAPGTKVDKGQPLAKIRNVFGDEVEVVSSPREGYVISYLIAHAGIPLNQIVGEGDPVCMIGCLESNDS
jgi:uncharacterized protein